MILGSLGRDFSPIDTKNAYSVRCWACVMLVAADGLIGKPPTVNTRHVRGEDGDFRYSNIFHGASVVHKNTSVGLLVEAMGSTF